MNSNSLWPLDSRGNGGADKAFDTDMGNGFTKTSVAFSNPTFDLSNCVTLRVVSESGNNIRVQNKASGYWYKSTEYNLQTPQYVKEIVKNSGDAYKSQYRMLGTNVRQIGCSSKYPHMYHRRQFNMGHTFKPELGIYTSFSINNNPCSMLFLLN